MPRKSSRKIPIYCEAHKGVFMVDVRELEGKSEVKCSVCGTVLAFMPKDPLQMMINRMYLHVAEQLEKLFSSMDRFLGEDWYRKRGKK